MSGEGDSGESETEVEYDPSIAPTKIMLLEQQEELKQAMSVKKIMDDILAIVRKELEKTLVAAEKTRDEVSEPLSAAYRALQDAYLKLGPLRVEGTAGGTPHTQEVDVSVHKVAGVDIPSLTLRNTKKGPGRTYGFADTSIAVDTAAKRMEDALPSIVRAAETENAIYRLGEKLKKTRRVLNAVQEILIPQYRANIRHIKETLEEGERDEHVSQKHLKKLLERKASERSQQQPVAEREAKPKPVKTLVKK